MSQSREEADARVMADIRSNRSGLIGLGVAVRLIGEQKIRATRCPTNSFSLSRDRFHRNQTGGLTLHARDGFLRLSRAAVGGPPP
jgi:hypothetical protein